MRIFAHRGWAAGEFENTLEAFKKSANEGLAGVEFDVRFGKDGRSIVVSHDHTEDPEVLVLDQALPFLKSTSFELLIEFKEYTPELFLRVSELLEEFDLSHRSTIFAFSEIAHMFPWDGSRTVRLGVISRYPHHITRDVKKYRPDMVLMGWGSKPERFLFKLVWSFLSLSGIIQKYPDIRFVIGVAYDVRDIAWLSKKNGLYGVTMDK